MWHRLHLACRRFSHCGFLKYAKFWWSESRVTVTCLICSCYCYFDLCSTSTYLHYFHLLISNLLLHPMIFWTFVFPSSVFCSPFVLRFLDSLLPYSVFYLMFFCSIFIIIFPPSVHYSLPSLPDLDNLTSIPCDSVSHLFTFSVLHHSLYYSESCSIKFLLICTYSPDCNCHLPLQKYNPPLSPLLV